MTTSKRTFLIELYTEYLEEASFLYEQRLKLLKNPEISWTKIGESEERFEAHIDGLVVGDELALEVCGKQVHQGDLGQLHAIVRVLCRQRRKDLLLTTLEQTGTEDPEQRKALTNALKYELPWDWHRDVELLLKVKPSLSPTVMAALGYQRAEPSEDFPKILRSSAPKYALDLIWSAGRIGNHGLSRELEDYLESTDEAVRSAAALALLRLGNQRALRRCEMFRNGETWQFVPLGLGGTRSTARTLLEYSHASGAADDELTALGLLGDVSAVPTLLSNLSNPRNAASAATALQLMSGTDLSERVFISDEIKEDELFEDERDKLRQGQLPTRADGQPFGTTVVRISQKIDDWAGWWAENESAFDPRVRYRYGTPYSPTSLLHSLQEEKTPHRIRQLAYEELVIRYGMSVPFEADMFVADQRKALVQIDQWIQANQGRFRDGAWYFHGDLMY